MAQARLWAASPLEAAASGVMRPGSFQVCFLSSDLVGLVDPRSAGLTRLGGFLACAGQLMAGSLLPQDTASGDLMAQVAGAGTRVLRCPAA